MSRAKTVCLTFMDFVDGPLKFRVPEGYKRLQINQFTCGCAPTLFIAPGDFTVEQGGKTFKFTQRVPITSSAFICPPDETVPPPFVSMACVGLGAWRDIISSISFPTLDCSLSKPRFTTTLTLENGGVVDHITGANFKFATLGQVSREGISFNYPPSFVQLPDRYPVLRKAGYEPRHYKDYREEDIPDYMRVSELQVVPPEPAPPGPRAGVISRSVSALSSLLSAGSNKLIEMGSRLVSSIIGGTGEVVVPVNTEDGEEEEAYALRAEPGMKREGPAVDGGGGEGSTPIKAPSRDTEVIQVGDELEYDPPFTPAVLTGVNSFRPTKEGETRQVPFTSSSITCSDPGVIVRSPNTIEGFTLGMQGNVYEITSRDLVFTPLVMNNLFFNNQSMIFQFTLL